ncbi:MAG: hypothetical protein RLZZ587_515 [Actinomycetota bacterium]
MDSVASLPSVGLAELDESWSLTRRYDTKFIVEQSELDKFFEATTTEFAALEIDGLRMFSYRTVYFDTPDLLLYRDHAQRRRRRVKVRTRLYRDSGRTRLEVKAKMGNGQTQKALFEDRAEFGLEEISLIDTTIADMYPTSRYSGLGSRLSRSAVTEFNRTTLISRTSAERITCDTDMFLESNGSRFRLKPGLVLVEVKSPQRISETVRQLRHLGWHSTSFSKYGAAIESTHDIRPRIHSAESLARKLQRMN